MKEKQLQSISGLTYLLSGISAIVALFVIYRISLDFVDPLQMQVTLQMYSLSENQIIILDIGEIFVYAALLILLAISLFKRYKKSSRILIVSIWFFIIVDFLVIEPFFSFKFP